MRIDWQSGEKNLPHGSVVDLDTMKPVSGDDRMCVFVDEEAGEYRCIVKRDGKWTGPDGKLRVETFHGRVKFFPFATLAPIASAIS